MTATVDENHKIYVALSICLRRVIRTTPEGGQGNSGNERCRLTLGGARKWSGTRCLTHAQVSSGNTGCQGASLASLLCTGPWGGEHWEGVGSVPASVSVVILWCRCCDNLLLCACVFCASCRYSQQEV